MQKVTGLRGLRAQFVSPAGSVEGCWQSNRPFVVVNYDDQDVVAYPMTAIESIKPDGEKQ